MLEADESPPFPAAGLGAIYGASSESNRTLDEVKFSRLHDGLRTAPHVEFAVDVGGVRLDSAEADDEARCDLFVGLSRGDETQDFEFTIAQYWWLVVGS